MRLKRHPKPSVDGLLERPSVVNRSFTGRRFEGGAEDVVVAVDRGSLGYPTNAFVTSAPAEELGLVDGADVDHDIAGPVVGSFVAVVVAAATTRRTSSGNRAGGRCPQRPPRHLRLSNA